MLRINYIAHYIIILSVVFAGVLSTHICLDDGVDSSSRISIVDDTSKDNSSTASSDCSQTSCCQHCNHLFDTGNNIVSSFSTIDIKTLGDTSYSPLISEHLNLPSRPPKA